jgi:hypothetical protein
MDPKITYIVIGLIVGAGVGYLAVNSQVVDVRGKLSDAQMQYVTLYTQFQILTKENTDLNTSYRNLMIQKSSLENSYTHLQSDYSKLRTDSQTASAYFKQLSVKITDLESVMKSYCQLPGAFTRTLNENEIKKVGDTVKLMTSIEPNYLAAYDKINNWVTGHITDVKDILFPYIVPITTIFNGTTVNTGYNLYETQEYISTPEFTLKQSQGDSESQAILDFAMMKYYDRYIKGESKNAYLTVMSFSDGTLHSAIFMPVTDGRICIMDPAGQYVTRDQEDATVKLAASEIPTYYNYWSNQDLLITNFTVYNIKTVDGSYTEIIKGNLAAMVAFFSS